MSRIEYYYNSEDNLVDFHIEVDEGISRPRFTVDEYDEMRRRYSRGERPFRHPEGAQLELENEVIRRIRATLQRISKRTCE